MIFRHKNKITAISSVLHFANRTATNYKHDFKVVFGFLDIVIVFVFFVLFVDVVDVLDLVVIFDVVIVFVFLVVFVVIVVTDVVVFFVVGV